MNRALTSTASIYISNGCPSAVNFQAEPEMPEHVLHRINNGRAQIDRSYPAKLSVSALGGIVQNNVLNLTLNRQCLVYAKKN